MFDYEKYIRGGKFPLVWCAGCGDGIVLKAMLRAIDTLEWEKNNVCMVSGIGCSSRLTGYVDCNTLHTTHGRAITFATGIKMAKPALNVIVVTGDGDATAIGGNHYIHAARRNIDLSVILFNNFIYGMTGGQVSPTTPRGRFASTAPYGNLENTFNISGLAQAAGATYVARGTVYHAVLLEKLIRNALSNKGFSVVEVISPCPTAFGRRNKLGNILELMNDQKDNCVTVAKSKRMSAQELKGKTIIGELVNDSKPECSAQYRQLIERCRTL